MCKIWMKTNEFEIGNGMELLSLSILFFDLKTNDLAPYPNSKIYHRYLGYLMSAYWIDEMGAKYLHNILTIFTMAIFLF